ncbi:alpha/beta fold hydrolase [Roseobacter sp.]|uniref:alpha/beta fold hydrolase n=1 Tax=Roseobacter sp. TaxID=1907202 RepID=UPI00385DB51E
MIWLLFIPVSILAYPWAIEAMRKPMNQKARAQAPGSFANLSQGVTHYQWYGADTGPVAVCIHGLTTPSFVWRGVAQGLVMMGFRVLVYDLYGRGFSDRPHGLQDRAFFMQQLADLLADQGLEDDITLLGYSMGGAISAIFAASQPDRIRQLILLAPAGMKPVQTGNLGFALKLPVIGAWLILSRYPAILRKAIATEKSGPNRVEGISDRQKAELNWRGFIRSVRASLTGLLSEDLANDHMTLKTEGVPLLAIWGAEDDVIPLTCADKLTDLNANAQNEAVEGAGHGLIYSHTADVLEHIDHFTRQSV